MRALCGPLTDSRARVMAQEQNSVHPSIILPQLACVYMCIYVGIIYIYIYIMYMCVCICVVCVLFFRLVRTRQMVN